jgi:adenylate kinase
MKDIVLFGMPGSGKGTQAELLLEKFKGQLGYLSTGEVFRALTSQKNGIGDYVKDRMESGLLINDDITVHLFEAFLCAVNDEKKHMLLDGYPRTIYQLERFLETEKNNNREVIGIFFKLDNEEAIQRMLLRGRAWETREVLEVRIQEYYAKTQPLLDAFAQYATLITVDATPSIQEVYVNVLDILA